jgi:hypothetical protein
MVQNQSKSRTALATTKEVKLRIEQYEIRSQPTLNGREKAKFDPEHEPE